MSKSLKRVKLALANAGIHVDILEMPGATRTAADAARQAECQIDQIAKSIIFRGQETERLLLFITAGGRCVDAEKATILAGEVPGRADAAYVRSMTGFAIGGVAPIAHLTTPIAFWDLRLSEFDIIFAAAGTPHHIIAVEPATPQYISKAQPTDFTSDSCSM